METLFMHLHIKEGRATTAIQVEDGTAYVGLSFCSPKDQFSRKKGRLIAEGRLATQTRYSFEFVLSQDKGVKTQIYEKIMSDVQEGILEVPRWAQGD